MASEILTRPLAPATPPTTSADGSFSFWKEIERWLMPLASLRVTVVLFALWIFLIFAGTLAQVKLDVWDVVRLYFRAWLVEIPLQVFFPPSFFPSRPEVSGWVPFPGGLTLGVGLAINLVAAHGLRFKVQARGMRLIGGLAVIALGAALTYLVILGGTGKEDIEGRAIVSWPTLWLCMKLGLTALLGVCLYGWWKTIAAGRLERNLLFTASVLLGALVGWLWYQGDSARLADASLRILWQLIEGTLAGLVILAGCVLVFRRRAGVVLLHAGVGLMMANELVVYGLHSEAMMRIQEGETVNYVEDVRSTELAVIDRSAADHDQVTAVPRDMLVNDDGARRVSDPRLPFDIRVEQYLRNSELRDVPAGAKNPGTAGAGQRLMAVEKTASTGTDTDSKVDIAAAYIKLLDKKDGHSLGTWLVGQELRPQKVDVDGKTYDIALRFKRSYKPYSMHLDDIIAEMYPGTVIPKDYRAKLQLVDPSRNEDRAVEIWMNHPLRFAGETFYQSGYERNDKGEATKLSVVTNTGWMIPYVACMLVIVGMAAHFSIVLMRFLRNRDGASATPAAAARRAQHDSAQPLGWTGAGFLIPAAVVVAMACWVVGKTQTPRMSDDSIALYQFGQLPLVDGGRIKPFDTLARNSLRIISNRETFLDQDGKRQPAVKWLLDVITHSDAAFEDRVFRIENSDVLALMGLKERAATMKQASFTYSADELRDHMDDLVKQLDVAQELDAKKEPLDLFQRKVLELGKRLRLFMTLTAAFQQPRIREDHLKDDLLGAIQREGALAEMHPPLAVPPETGEDKPDARWQPFATAWTRAYAELHILGQQPNLATVKLEAIFAAYRKHDVAAFNKGVAEYQELLAKNPPVNFSSEKVRFESFFNYFEPFYDAAILYVIAFVIAACGWLVWTGPLNRTALWLNLLALAVHTAALVTRMYISGRPPVTNLYSSAVFIGWGCVVLGLLFEYIYRLGIGNVVASLAGFSALLIAHMLADGGDTFTVLQAVLDTNFWLAFHVTCITLGYATTYVAGLLGLLYVLRGVCTRSLTPEVGKELSRMIYGTLCFAIFFSFFGTVLGGLWADDSWGRFWGWDPKENGALIIVLWNALVLHARWGGLVKQRGLAVLAIGGNVVTSWSWFGVNELGIGLHSYGFTEGVLLALGLFVVSQLVIVAVGSLPKTFWRSAAVA